MYQKGRRFMPTNPAAVNSRRTSGVQSADKYENAVLVLLQELGGCVRGKVKLAKLLYFSDFDHFERHGASITGETYYARRLGPLGIRLAKVTRDLQTKGAIQITEERDFDGGEPTVCLRLQEEPDWSVFTEDEIKDLRRVARRYGHLSGNELQAIAHNQAPWRGTEPDEPIAYELAYYRGSEFTD